MHLQGKANGRKVVGFGKVRNLQGTESAGKDKLESEGKEIARNGIWKEMEAVRNRICKDWNLQVKGVR